MHDENLVNKIINSAKTLYTYSTLLSLKSSTLEESIIKTYISNNPLGTLLTIRLTTVPLLVFAAIKEDNNWNVLLFKQGVWVEKLDLLVSEYSQSYGSVIAVDDHDYFDPPQHPERPPL